MINNSTANYAFIRACIVFLRYIAPLGAAYCVIFMLLRPTSYRVPVVLEIWAIAEIAFFALIYVPRTILLRRAASHPKPLPREQRRKLFNLCLGTVENPEKYLKGVRHFSNFLLLLRQLHYIVMLTRKYASG